MRKIVQKKICDLFVLIGEEYILYGKLLNYTFHGTKIKKRKYHKDS